METKKKTKLPIVTLLLVTLLILIGTSYAYFDYSFIGKENTIKQSDISVKLLESNKEIINIQNQLPMSDEQGIEQTDTGNVFDFSVETKSESDIKIGYKINIEKLDPDEGYTNLTDDQIKIYLTDTNDNKILGPLKISELENYNLYEDINIHSKTNNTQTDKYRIRVWIDQDVQVKNWDENTKQQYKFKIGVGSTENEGSYIITYNSNGGTGTMGPSTYKENTQETLRKNTFTKGGYTFKGWAETPDGEATYKDQNIATNLTTDQNEKNKTLYAIWQPNTYTVTYNPNGGSLSLGFTSTTTDYPWIENNGVYKSGNYNISSSTSTMKSDEFTLTETGDISFDWAVSSESASYDYLYYTIYKDGTALSGTGTSTKIGGYTSSDTEDNLTYKTVTKTLEAGTYTIEFSYTKDSSANYGLDRGYVKNLIVPGYGENKTMESSSFTVGQNNKLKQNQYTKKGYTFKGWNTNKNETNTNYQDENDLTEFETKVKENENINLYAIWDINKYTVNVVVQNGTVDTSSKQIEYNKNGTFTLTPSIEKAIGSITCTNNQNGKIKNNVLTVSNITNNTTCTINFKDTFTTLYEDETLIINESLKDRESNLSSHGEVTKEYEPMSDSNSYVMNSESSQPWYNEQTKIKGVEIGQTIKPVSTANWFSNLSNMTTGDFSELDTSQVTDMNSMFSYAGENATTFSLEGLSNWDTSSVTSMKYIFNYVGKKATTWNIGDLSSWDTSKVTDMTYMFRYAGQNATTWSIGDLSNWNTSRVTSMQYMFEGAGSKANAFNLNLSNWNTSNVIYTISMFEETGHNATTFNLNLSNWDVSNVTSMLNMFSYTGYSATNFTLNLSNWNNTTNVTNMQNMFKYAGYSATTFSLDLSSWNTSKVTNMSSMFYCAGQKATTWNIGDLSNWDTSQVTNMEEMFRNTGQKATTWSVGNLSSWNTSKVTNMSSMFYYAGENATTWNIGDLSNWDTSQVTNMSYIFSNTGKNATTWSVGDLSNWDTSQVTNMSSMFSSAGYSATTWNVGDLSSWNTSKVTDMHAMFSYAGQNVTTWNIGDLSKWDTSQVTDIGNIFSSAGQNATTWSVGDLSSWNTSKITNMSSMFSYAGQKATTWSIGDLSKWDTSQVTNMSNMFSNTGENATTWSVGDLSSWDTSKVINMSSMFEGTGYSATTFSLDLSSWDTSQVTNMSSMFSYAGQNATTFNLNLSNWDVSKIRVMKYMFGAAGSNATTWSVIIPKTTGTFTNTTDKFYGYYESVYAVPADGKSFTLAS